MSEHPDDGRSTTRVIFALTVSSPSAIPEFAGIPLRNATRRPDDAFHYDFGTAGSHDDMWGAPVRGLDAIVDAALDRLAETGIDPAELAVDGRTVTARFSVSPGSETIESHVVRRLAGINARILMDSWG